VRSLVDQDYPGRLDVIVVDDDSSDDTAAVAEKAARGARRAPTIVAGRTLPAGWTGKLWALKQGVGLAEQRCRPDYLLLTDADIVHAPDAVAWLARQAVAGDLVLVSFMAKLRCQSFAERVHVPAFVYFFQMLFPFVWVNNPRRRTAAAAGGCMLLKANALREAGGLDAIRNALIDDCALARRMKRGGPIWLGLTDRVRSIRPYAFADCRRMIARSAYAQLGFSPVYLLAALVGLLLTFVAPALLALLARGLPQFLGVAAWCAMAISMQPILRFYRLSPAWGLALPAVAVLYAVYTLISAVQHARNRGGEWKGRFHVNAPTLQ
jgi:hopene-associated glycosyltransferase HpnB